MLLESHTWNIHHALEKYMAVTPQFMTLTSTQLLKLQNSEIFQNPAFLLFPPTLTSQFSLLLLLLLLLFAFFAFLSITHFLSLFCMSLSLPTPPPRCFPPALLEQPNGSTVRTMWNTRNRLQLTDLVSGRHHRKPHWYPSQPALVWRFPAVLLAATPGSPDGPRKNICPNDKRAELILSS